MVFEQRVPQVVGPRPDRLDEPCLDRRRVVLGRRSVPAADDVVHAHEARLAQLERPVEGHAIQGFEQDAADAFAVLGVEAVARDQHQALDEAVERVAPHEQAQALALAQPEDPDRDVEQLAGLHLEQRVARVGLEDLLERLAVVAGRWEAGVLEHAVDLAADDRDRAGACLVRGGGVQPEEAALAARPALAVVLLDADVVEVGRAVHGRGGVGLGQHQDLRLAGEPDRLRGELLGWRAGGFSEDPQPGAVDGLEEGVAGILDQVVVAIAEEGEVVVGQPVQERLGLLGGGRVDRRGVLVELRGQVARLGAHRLPVLGRGADLVEDLFDTPAQVVEELPVVLAADLGVEDRLGDRVIVFAVGFENLEDLAVLVAADPHHRVDDQVDAVALAREVHRHRVDDERHVVGDDLDQRVRRLPAVLLELRVVDPDLRLAGRAVLGQVPVRHGGAVQVERIAIRQVLGRHPLVVLPHERLARHRLFRGQTLPHALADRVDQLGLEFRPLYCHLKTSSVMRSSVPGPWRPDHRASFEPTPGAGAMHVLQSRCSSAGNHANMCSP